MFDQANHLRQLMRGARHTAAGGGTKRPRLLVIVGSKKGVGTTTLAVNVAVAMAQRKRRTLIVDGDLGKADVAGLCGTRQGYSIGDVLAGRHRIQEAIQRGPAGTYVLPGARATGHVTDCGAAAHERLIVELTQLRSFDDIVIDAGCGLNRVVERFWRAASRVLLAATADNTSVIDAYAVLKTAGAQRPGPPVHVVMNMADEHQVQGAFSRLREACRRFLGLELGSPASLPYCADIVTAARRKMPLVLSSPGCRTARVLEALAAAIDQSTGESVGSGRSGAFSVQAELRQPGDEIQIQQSIQAACA